MASFRGLSNRLRAWWRMPSDIAALRVAVEQMHQLLLQLNHEVHAGSEDALPLLQGYIERLRLDADTSISATQVIERQLRELEQTLHSLRGND